MHSEFRAGASENLEMMRVDRLAEWAMGETQDGLESSVLQLPPIQRTALWRPSQILALWDSLLRGMPIGMFYLLPAGQDDRPVTRHVAKQDAPGWSLLDGQQRLRAILLAKMPPRESKKCLWIDLGAEIKAGGLYLPLRLTTASQPFGYDESGSKLALRQRRDAREQFDKDMKEVAAYDKGLADHELFDLRPTLPRPAAVGQGNKLVVQAREFIELRKLWATHRTDFPAAVRDLLKLEQPHSHSDNIINRLSQGFDRLANATVPVMKVRPELLEGDKNDQSQWVLRWFERIGAGGTPLSGPERNYSIFKHHHPHVHDAVTEIEQAVGALMSPVDVVDTALRIANAEQDRFWPLDHVSFLRELKEPDDKPQGTVFGNCLRRLIPARENTAKGELLEAFQISKDALLFDIDNNPSGLPIMFLTDLPAAAVQVLIYYAWLCRGRALTKLDRDEMIRFSLFWHLCADNHEKAERRAFRYLKEKAGTLAGFPGRELYEELTRAEDKSAQAMVRPADLSRYISDLDANHWPGDGQLFNHRSDDKDDERRFFRTWWMSEGKMLLWLQRRYLAGEFKNYDPSSDRDEEKPYDLDHIQPQSTWSDHWTTQCKRITTESESARKSFHNGRWLLGNAPGNLRWIGSSKNRADGALSIREKFELKRASGVVTWTRPDWAADVFDDEALSGWWDSDDDGGADRSKHWSSERMIAFRKAVEERTMWLYKAWWEQAGFDAWLDCPDAAASRVETELIRPVLT